MTAPRKLTIAVLFNARNEGLPLRAANLTHLMAWERYARHNVIYINVAYGVPWRLLARADIDALIFDTLFCSMHWTPEYFKARTALCLAAARFNCPKIALVQDEFTNIDLVADFLGTIGVTHVFSCARAEDWPKFYPRLDPARVTFRTALTAYVDAVDADAPESVPPSQRLISIGYRSGHDAYWLGHHGVLKSQIGARVRAAAERRGLVVDIAQTDPVHYLKGGAWFDFLRRCRSVIGVEGGASINDRDGRIRLSVERYLAEHPDASFETVRDACFPDRDGEVDLACISPRHFEAAITRTAQVLVEGRYSGVLEPWRHYIPLKRDFSNMDAALDALMDNELVDAMVERAYADVVASGRWSYAAFVRDVEASIIEPGSSGGIERHSVRARFASWLLQRRSAFLWRYAQMESTPAFDRTVATLARGVRRFERIPGAGRPIAALRVRARRWLGIAEKRG